MKENDIRPDGLLNRYLELSAADAEHCFFGVTRLPIPCVGCGDIDIKQEFEKNGFGYAICEKCGTLFQTPRPSIDAFEAFYRDSVSARYWAEEFFPAVAEARREIIFKPRAAKLSALCEQKGINIDRVIDVGAGYGILLDEWRRLHPKTQLLAIEPSAVLAQECRVKGLAVVEDIAENVTDYKEYADLVVCFEVLEHVYDPLEFVRTLSGLVRPGGYVFISTLGIDGFDMQVLWDMSNQISPPHHINFLSVVGFRRLFERAGLECIDVSTPGVLDVDIVRNACKRNSDLLKKQRFIKKLISDDILASNFQKFLSENCLSSHTWVMGKKLGYSND